MPRREPLDFSSKHVEGVVDRFFSKGWLNARERHEIEMHYLQLERDQNRTYFRKEVEHRRKRILEALFNIAKREFLQYLRSLLNPGEKQITIEGQAVSIDEAIALVEAGGRVRDMMLQMFIRDRLDLPEE